LFRIRKNSPNVAFQRKMSKFSRNECPTAWSLQRFRVFA